MEAKHNEKVLIVDDEESIRRIIDLQLRRSGFETIQATNGKEGLEMARMHLPDLILLDLMMPEMDGHEVVQCLKADHITSQIPVIILTAKWTKSDRIAGLSAGVNDYLTKPFEMKELMMRIQNVLKWSKQQRSANPLTGLPGNVSIEEELEKTIDRGDPFAVVYVDLDNFKAYNDYYGYAQGDKAIRMLARILVDSCANSGRGGEFVGHIGGDDFLFIAPSDTAEAIGEKILEDFRDCLAGLVRPEDTRRGYIEVEGRTGEVKRFPLLSVTLAMVTSETTKIEHVAQVGDLASEVKRYGKSVEGSVLVKDRRAKDSQQGMATTGGSENHGTS